MGTSSGLAFASQRTGDQRFRARMYLSDACSRFGPSARRGYSVLRQRGGREVPAMLDVRDAEASATLGGTERWFVGCALQMALHPTSSCRTLGRRLLCAGQTCLLASGGTLCCGHTSERTQGGRAGEGPGGGGRGRRGLVRPAPGASVASPPSAPWMCLGRPGSGREGQAPIPPLPREVRSVHLLAWVGPPGPV